MLLLETKDCSEVLGSNFCLANSSLFNDPALFLFVVLNELEEGSGILKTTSSLRHLLLQLGVAHIKLL